MKLQRNLPYWLLVCAAALWLGAVLLAPWARARGSALAFFLYQLFQPLCHQLPERSFFCWGEPLAVCQRCFGLYTGFLAGLLFLPFCRRLCTVILERPRLALLFAAPMAIDWLLFGLNVPASRFSTGLLASLPVAVFAWMASDQLYQRARAAFGRSLRKKSREMDYERC